MKLRGFMDNIHNIFSKSNTIYGNQFSWKNGTPASSGWIGSTDSLRQSALVLISLVSVSSNKKCLVSIQNQQYTAILEQSYLVVKNDKNHEIYAIDLNEIFHTKEEWDKFVLKKYPAKKS